MAETEAKPLKLRARDLEDMDVIAALLQDALVPMTDVRFLRTEKRFVLVLNRFNWALGEDGQPSRPAQEPDNEDAPFEDVDGPPPFERINSGLCFDRVQRVRTRGLTADSKKEILNLLTIKAEPKAITLIFSDDMEMRLDVTGIVCHLEDLGRAWPTRWRPDHDAGDQEAEDQGAEDGQAGPAQQEEQSS